MKGTVKSVRNLRVASLKVLNRMRRLWAGRCFLRYWAAVREGLALHRSLPAFDPSMNPKKPPVADRKCRNVEGTTPICGRDPEGGGRWTLGRDFSATS